MPHAYKLLFVGSEGSGKTTAIARVSDFTPIETDVLDPCGTGGGIGSGSGNDGHNAADASDRTPHAVALDYGECSLPDGHKLLLYGAPAQSRFQFTWRIVARGVVGIVFLVDSTRPDPCADLAGYLDAFADLLRHTVAVVGVGRMPASGAPAPSMEAYYQLLDARGLSAPVFGVDVRQREDVLLLIDALFHQIEAVTQTDGQMETLTAAATSGAQVNAAAS